MRSLYVSLIGLFLFMLPAIAELQSVTVGGELRIRGNYWRNTFNTTSQPVLIGNNVRWNANVLRGRPIGDPVGGQTIISYFDWDSAGDDYSLVVQRARLNITAEFTQEIAAFIELDSFDVWGENFRSDYLTGLDNRAQNFNNVTINQAYIQAENIFGEPLRLRIGRQELLFGKGWLIGDNSNHPEFSCLSFDAVRLSYAPRHFEFDAFWSKLVERSPIKSNGDTDFSGIYARYHPIESISIDAYWFWVRDAAERHDINSGILLGWIESWRGLNTYGTSHLHTLGLRMYGAVNRFDYDVEAAFQLGDASAVGFLFKPFNYGDNRAKYNSWAVDLDVGYRFDILWQPRINFGAGYFYGEDNRGISFRDWINPFLAFQRPKSSISFNRLFSNTVHSYFLDEMGELSNFWTVRTGISAFPLESVEAGMNLAWFGVVDRFEMPRHIRVQGLRVPILPPLSFLTQAARSDIGWELGLWAKYHYSEDLVFKMGWTRLFTGGALHDGNFNDLNGLVFNGGTGTKDADYFYIEATLQF